MGKLKIELLGTNFTIQANEDNEYLEKLLGYYKNITEDVNKIDSIQTPLQVAILSGIMLCDELYKEKQKKVQLENGSPVIQTPEVQNASEIEERTQAMLDKISKVV